MDSLTRTAGMLTESGRVVAVEQDHLWVETISRSACGNCQARAGCGQSLLARWAEKNAYLRVPLDNGDPASFAVDDQLTLGIPDDVVVKSSLLIYLLPIMLLLAGAIVGEQVGGSEGASIVGAFLGLGVGSVMIKALSVFTAQSRRVQPVILASHGSRVAVARCGVIN